MRFQRAILFAGSSSFNGLLSLDQFRQMAETAKEIGFTHVDLGCAMVERSRHQLTNNGHYVKDYDFYPEYTAAFPSYFKFYVPELLKPYLPEDAAKRNLESMHQRAEILQSFGLKGAFFGNEPQFLPEAVFEAHPQWRGARTDYSGRSLVPYFAPCVDRDEVLALYTESAKGICEAAPCLEFVYMLTGDSGAGICWGELYTGTNGPAFCRDVPMEKRISRFCRTLIEPMKAQGNPDALAVIHRTLPWANSAPVRKMPGVPGGTIFTARPPIDKPVCYENPIAFLEELSRADGFDNLIVNLEAPEWQLRKDGIYPEIFRTALHESPRGGMNHALMVKAAVEKTQPERNAENYTDAMMLLSQATREYTLLACNLFYGCMSDRWITRPFLFIIPPMDSEETAYYRDYIFNVNGEKAFRDMLDFHGGRWPRFGKTVEEGTFSAFICDRIIGKLDKVIALLGKETNEGWRIRALRALIINIRNILRFTGFLDELKAGKTPNRTLAQQVMRSELDNCDELIEVLEKGPENVFHLTKTVEQEHTFQFGPDFADQLRMKKKQMIEHWHDLDDILEGKKEFPL